MERKVSLVLGSGGARGFAHIGVIRELLKRGYKVKAISGSSMGAAVGGIFASGKLKDFEEWSRKLNKRDAFRLMDFTISSQGIIKGDRILSMLKEMIGEQNIEDLDIPFTAVATDIHKHEEVWLEKGDLFDVIRASSAIPTLITPSKIGDRILVNGGVLNPLPIEPVLRHKKNIIVAVNINAKVSEVKSSINGFHGEEKEDHRGGEDYRQKIIANVRSWLNMKSKPTKKSDETLGYLGLLNASYDLM